jgi:hypothetical protein
MRRGSAIRVKDGCRKQRSAAATLAPQTVLHPKHSLPQKAAKQYEVLASRYVGEEKTGRYATRPVNERDPGAREAEA